jgi:hypothetical protein
MPGTMLAGANAACSTSAKTFSGLRLSSKYPTSSSGKSPFGQTFVRSKGLKGKALSLGVRHHLDKERPAREILGLDAFEEVPLMALAILPDKRLGFGIGQVLNALLGTEMEFDPGALVCGVNEAVGVAAESMHVAEAFGDAALAHDDRDLMQGFRQQRPKIPVVVGAAHAGPRIALDGMVEIGKTQGIAEEEHRRVVADDVPVAFFGVELQRKPANVALGIGGAALAGHGREAGKHRRLLADL